MRPDCPFGPIRQLAFLTRDIRASIDFYLRLGVGPWFYGDRAVFESLTCRGQAIAPDLSYAVANWGDLQIELLQQHDDTPAVTHRRWMEGIADRERQHHVAIWPEDIDERIAEAQASGFEIVQDGMTAAGRFLYLIHPENPSFILEMTHATPGRRAFSEHVRETARNWDGSRPVRPFGVIE